MFRSNFASIELNKDLISKQNLVHFYFTIVERAENELYLHFYLKIFQINSIYVERENI